MTAHPDTLDAAAERTAFEVAAAECAARAAAERLRAPSGLHECIDCGGPIGPLRLAVAPGAMRCLHCAQIHEHDRAAGAR